MLHVRHQRAISTVHPLPVIFIRSSTNETDLIVLAIATESWPSKTMRAKFSEESLQEFHVCPSLRHGPELGGVICSEKWRVNQFDYHAGTLSNYGSASGYKLPCSWTSPGHWIPVALASEQSHGAGRVSASRTSVSLHSISVGESKLHTSPIGIISRIGKSLSKEPTRTRR